MLVAVPFASSALSSISLAPASQATHPPMYLYLCFYVILAGVCVRVRVRAREVGSGSERCASEGRSMMRGSLLLLTVSGGLRTRRRQRKRGDISWDKDETVATMVDR